MTRMAHALDIFVSNRPIGPRLSNWRFARVTCMLGWRRGGHLCRVADNTVWSHWQVASRSSEVNSRRTIRSFTFLFFFLPYSDNLAAGDVQHVNRPRRVAKCSHIQLFNQGYVLDCRCPLICSTCCYGRHKCRAGGHSQDTELQQTRWRSSSCKILHSPVTWHCWSEWTISSNTRNLAIANRLRTSCVYKVITVSMSLQWPSRATNVIENVTVW